ncbi:unnamed protein product [Adineta ricciae]|uniref:Uncharacterized protein n=1 Tax=Adineta ricciae TaxID=249248 RepID=A0A813ZTG7_ADIRI|nr:unnamed protein product [Adineta ricciae]
MYSRRRVPMSHISRPIQTQNLMTSFPTQPLDQQTSFPELVGRSSREAVAYLSARGLSPVLVRPNQPMTMDYRMDRVRVVVDPSRRIVIQTPTVALPRGIGTRPTSFPELVGRSPIEAITYLTSRGLKPALVLPNQPVSMDYRTDRVRLVTDLSRRRVIETPRVG